MELNKKGMTLVEIIISIALISIVLIFLFSLLVDVKDMNDEASINSDYLINKALMLKNIEEDLDKATTELKINTCNIHTFYTTYPDEEAFESGIPDYFIKEDENINDNTTLNIVKKRLARECIKFTFDNDDSKAAYLGIYYYKNKDSYVISYIHGDTKATRLLPEFEKYNVDTNGNIKPGFEIKYSNSSDYTTECKLNGNDKCAFVTNNTGKELIHGVTFNKIEIPIIGSDGKDYSILISYYKKGE